MISQIDPPQSKHQHECQQQRVSFYLHEYNSDEFTQKRIRQKIKRRPGTQTVRIQSHSVSVKTAADSMKIIRDEEALVLFFVRIHDALRVQQILIRINGLVFLND